MVGAVPAVPFQKPIDDVLRVRVLEVRGGDRGNFRTFCRAHAKTSYPTIIESAGVHCGSCGAGRRSLLGQQPGARSARARCTMARSSSTGTSTPSTACSITAAISASVKSDGQFDLPRAKEGGLGAMFFSIFVTEDYYPGAARDQAGAAHDGYRARTDRDATARRSKSRGPRPTSSASASAARWPPCSISKAASIWTATRRCCATCIASGCVRSQLSGAQLDQQLRRFVLLAGEVARLERPRPRIHPRDEPAGHGDQRVARVRRSDGAGDRRQHRSGGRDPPRPARPSTTFRATFPDALLKKLAAKGGVIGFQIGNEFHNRKAFDWRTSQRRQAVLGHHRRFSSAARR